MKPILRSILLICLFGLLIKCKEDEAASRNYPRINTLSVSEITPEGATFNAKITLRGDFEIINYGFVWGKIINPLIDYNDRIIISENIQEGNFSNKITATLKEGVSYYVRAFVETNDYTVYGENVEFVSLGSSIHQLNDISPTEISYGDTVTISGKNFSRVFSLYNITLGDFNCNPTYANDTILKFLVPYERLALESELSVSMNGNAVKGPEKLTLKPLILESAEPSAARTNEEVTLKGQIGYLPYFNNTKLMVGGKEVVVTKSATNLMKFIVPAGITDGTIELTIGVQSTESEVFNYLKPMISENSIEGTWGDAIEIAGSNFQTGNDGNKVIIGDIECEITSRKSDHITFILSPDAQANKPVVLKDAGHEIILNFTFTQPIIESFYPNGIDMDFGDEITLTGSNFHPYQNTVFFTKNNNDQSEATILSNSRNQIKFTVPDDAYSVNGKVAVRISFYGLDAYDTISLKPPVIADFSPKIATEIGQEVTISGSGFSPSIENNSVLFNGKPLEVISASANAVIARIPSNIISESAVSETIVSTISINSGGQIANSIESLELNYKGTWTKIVAPPSDIFARYGEREKVGNELIFFGGASGEYKTDMFSFNTLSQSWTKIGELPDGGRSFAFSENFDGIIYHGFGSRNSTQLSDINTYDYFNGTWSSISTPENLSWARYAATFVDDKLNLLSREIIYSYNPELDTWEQTDHLEYPDPHVSNGIVFPHTGFYLNNIPYFILQDQDNSDSRFAYIKFYKKSQGMWILDGVLDRDYKWGQLFEFVKYKDRTYVISLNGIYELYMSDYSLRQIDVPSELSSTQLSFAISGDDGIYLGFANNTFWKFDPLTQ